MKVGKSVRMPKAVCLSCRAEVDGATAVGETGKVRPTPGDFTCCLYCGNLMVFDRKLQLREPTSTELYEIAGDERLVAFNLARKMTQKPQ